MDNALDSTDLHLLGSKLRRVARWGADLWMARTREEDVDAVLWRIGWGGRLISPADWPEHLVDTSLHKDTSILKDWPGEEDFTGAWEEAWGQPAKLILAAVTNWASSFERGLADLLLEATEKVVAPKRHAQQHSRRRFNGWFPEIGLYRRGIRTLHRLMAACRSGNAPRYYSLLQRASASSVLSQSVEPLLAPAARLAWVSKAAWSLRLSRIQLLCARLSRTMHGKARSDKRARISEAVRHREQAYKQMRFRKVLDSVLRRTSGGASLTEVVDKEGRTHKTGTSVKQVATDYFRDTFSGAHTNTWYEEAGIGEGVKTFFADSVKGRKAREDGLRGVFHEDWFSTVPKQYQRMMRMVRFKARNDEDDLATREAWFGDLLQPISEQEWNAEWARKSRLTSGGASGVRPDMIKAGGRKLHLLLREFYSNSIHLGLVPPQWKRAVIVAIEKIPGVKRVDKLRPLKLLEVTMKGVVSIVKSRLRSKLEDAHLLHRWQQAFRSERRTTLSAVGIVNLIEDAIRYGKDLHLVLIDIKKAFDSVVRTIGKEAALRRLGVPMKAVEFFMELDRGNQSEVRTFWDSILDPEESGDHWFDSLRGFAQGSADAPLLWIVFYDMVLSELEHSGVGYGVRTETGWACQTEGGVNVFADDTALVARSTASMQVAVNTLQEVLATVMLTVAPEKSRHLALIHDPHPGVGGGRLTLEDLERGDTPHRVALNDTLIPWVEADVGERYLGYRIDLLGDWGEQVAILERKLDDFTETLKYAAVSRGLLMYCINAVLVPRLLYPLTLASINPREILELESKALRWIRRKLGVPPTYATQLIYAPTHLGGLGWVSWTTRVLQARTRLALDLATHDDVQVRLIWESMRLRFHEELRSNRLCLGDNRSDSMKRTEEGDSPGTICKSWMGTFDELLRHEGGTWRDGWSPLPKRVNDTPLLAIAAGMEDPAAAESVRKGADICDVQWLSDLADASGTYLFRWDRVGATWKWVHTLATALGAMNARMPTGHDAWRLQPAHRMEGWNNEAADDVPVRAPAVWAEGIARGSVVTVDATPTDVGGARVALI